MGEERATVPQQHAPPCGCSNVKSKEVAWGLGLRRLLAPCNRLRLGPMGTEPTRSFRTDACCDASAEGRLNVGHICA